MRKWGIALAAVGMLAAGAQAGNLNFVPVNTGQNLAAPVPVYGPIMQKKSFVGRMGDKIKSLSLFSTKKVLPTPPTPQMPTSASGTGILGKAATLLKSPTMGISGGAK